MYSLKKHGIPTIKSPSKKLINASTSSLKAHGNFYAFKQAGGTQHAVSELVPTVGQNPTLLHLQLAYVLTLPCTRKHQMQ